MAPHPHPVTARLAGRVAVVTGSGRGIGLATAARLAGEGAHVVLSDVDGDVVAASAEALDGEHACDVSAFAGDLSRAAGAERLIAHALDRHGRLDIVVNNAGTTRDGMFHRGDREQWDFVLGANLGTAYEVTRAAIGPLREAAKAALDEDPGRPSCGKLLFTSSTSFYKGNVGQSNYAAAKGALVGLTRTLSRELGPLRINVNAVAPGFVATRLTGSVDGELGMPEAARERAIAQIPLGRAGTPDDIAAASAFLVSPDADFITGHVLVVSGGGYLA
jgi:3-oxoacyl-[acyl-carrier protein] reductase